MEKGTYLIIIIFIIVDYRKSKIKLLMFMLKYLTIFTNTFVDLANEQHVVNNNVVELERPIGMKYEKAKWKAPIRPIEDIAEIPKMKYTLLEELHVQEKEFFHLKEEKMQYDWEMKGHKIQ